MDIFNILALIGGLCLFLFGMNVMGEALERRAGNGLRTLLGRLANSKAAGFATGLGVTAVIQSSSATTVMVVGFVNSGIMTLRQAINVIMGANVGTTVTAWVLSLSGISGDSIFIKLLKPTSFTPILALIGIVMCMVGKTSKKKDTGTILLGFATLMYGMSAMSSSVGGLADIPEFQQLFVLFKNPILGVLVGAVLTAVIQSSSASVGILQALAVTGQVSFGAAIPIIMGQNIGTCITAMLSAIGANKNAKRAAGVHLAFNIIGTVVWLGVFSTISFALKPAFLGQSATTVGIAVSHSVFNILCTVLLLPMGSLLEKFITKIIPDGDEKTVYTKLDERLLVTPSIALEQCEVMAREMAQGAAWAFEASAASLKSFDNEVAEKIYGEEQKTDRYEDVLGTYLVKLSGQNVTDREGAEISKLLKLIGDFERISDHSVNILQSAEELREKEMEFTSAAQEEIQRLAQATSEILQLSLDAYTKNDIQTAHMVEPLEQVIDTMIFRLHDRHITRLKNGECSIEIGFILSDLLTNFERVADHCSNIAIRVIDAKENNMNVHQSLYEIKHSDPYFKEQYALYANKYLD